MGARLLHSLNIVAGWQKLLTVSLLSPNGMHAVRAEQGDCQWPLENKCQVIICLNNVAVIKIKSIFHAPDLLELLSFVNSFVYYAWQTCRNLAILIISKVIMSAGAQH